MNATIRNVSVTDAVTITTSNSSNSTVFLPSPLPQPALTFADNDTGIYWGGSGITTIAGGIAGSTITFPDIEKDTIKIMNEVNNLSEIEQMERILHHEDILKYIINPSWKVQQAYDIAFDL